MAMSDHSVIIVGAGPTGLMLAGELALAGVDVAIVERRSVEDFIPLRARGLHSRTIEILDQRGIADRFLSEGRPAQVAGFAWIRLDISDFPTRHPYGLALPQSDFERILAAWVQDYSVPIYRDREVVGFLENDDRVEIKLSNGQSLRAQYLVGCDGGRSLVRKKAGIEFPGWDPTTSHLIAEVEMREEPQSGLRHDSTGVHALAREGEGKPVRVLVTEQQLRTGEATLNDLSEALAAVYGTDFGLHSPLSLSRFTDVTRQAACYRKGRVLLAGDAAHVHYPAGGLGLNLGVQDAVNLGWKLAQVVRGTSPETLLDSYHSEQHPVAARVLRNTMAQVALLGRLDDRKAALRDVVSELLGMDEPRKHFAAMMSGFDVRYSSGEGHPLLGRRVPDLDLMTKAGPTRIFELLHSAQPLFLNFDPSSRFDLSGWADRVRAVDAQYSGTWELPAIGKVAPPAAVLVRPDGHVCWVKDPRAEELTAALGSWFGRPTERDCSADELLSAVASAPNRTPK
jgi:3-(3-hydroxy-phenyl)propionate hydroxylase